MCLDVSLKEVFCGSHKKVSYQRQVVGLDGHTVRDETASVDVYVRPGMPESTKLVFKGKGNEQPQCEPTDLIVSFKAVPHAQYKR